MQVGEAVELGLANDVDGDEHVVDAGVDHRFRLEQRLAGDAHCAESDLASGDLDAFVGLHVRPVLQAEPVAFGLPANEVPFQAIEIDDRGRCLDHGIKATASISTSKPEGNFAPTVVRAGYGSAKNSVYTSL